MRHTDTPANKIPGGPPRVQRGPLELIGGAPGIIRGPPDIIRGPPDIIWGPHNYERAPLLPSVDLAKGPEETVRVLLSPFVHQ